MSHSLYKGNYCYYMRQKYSHILRTLVQSPPLLPHTPFFPTHSQLLLSCRKWVSPPSGWSQADSPCTLRLQRSLWEDVNSAPSLPQKRVTQDLLDPWSRAWSTGSVREAAVKPCGARAETSPRTKAGSPEHRRQSSPLGCWGGDGAGRAGSICCVAISPDSSVVTLRD